MVTSIFLIITLLLGFAMLLSVPRAIRYYKNANPRLRLVMLAWSSVIIAQFNIFFQKDVFVQDIETLAVGSYFQIGWMAVAALLIVLLLPSHKTLASTWRLPLIAFVAYIGAGYVSIGLADTKLMAFYRVSQLALDVLLLLVAYAEQKRAKAPHMLIDVTVFWLIVVMFATALGAVVYPDFAFESSKGVFGFSLRGAIIHIHQNELGLMSALALLVSMVRLFGGGVIGGGRFLWFAMAIVSGCALFFAQARTSIASCMIALILAGVLLKQMRWMTYVFSLMAVGVLIYYWLSGSGLGIEEDVVAYMKRGVSDESLENLSGRTGLWEIGWKMLADSPIFGHGFAVGVRNSGVKYGIGEGMSMHNAHMEVLVNTGLLGYIPWIIFLVGVAAYVWKNFRMCRRVPAERLFAVMAMLMTFVILFRSALGHVLVTHQMNTLVLLSIYLYAALSLDIGLNDGVGASRTVGDDPPGQSRLPKIIQKKPLRSLLRRM